MDIGGDTVLFEEQLDSLSLSKLEMLTFMFNKFGGLNGAAVTQASKIVESKGLV